MNKLSFCLLSLLLSIVLFNTGCSKEEQNVENQKNETQSTLPSEPETTTEFTNEEIQWSDEFISFISTNNNVTHFLNTLGEYPPENIAKMTDSEFKNVTLVILVKEFQVPEDHADIIANDLNRFITKDNYNKQLSDNHTTVGDESAEDGMDDYTQKDDSVEIYPNDNTEMEELIDLAPDLPTDEHSYTDRWRSGIFIDKDMDNDGNSDYDRGGTDRDVDNDGRWDYDLGGTDRDMDNDQSWDYDNGGVDRDMDNDGRWDYDRGGVDRDMDNDGRWDYDQGGTDRDMDNDRRWDDGRGGRDRDFDNDGLNDY